MKITTRLEATKLWPLSVFGTLKVPEQIRLSSASKNVVCKS